VAEDSTAPLNQVLAEHLGVSLAGSLPESTRRQVHGRVSLPGKVTAVIGMRRAGKTTFVHQLRRERLDSGTPRHCLPYINFEDERLSDLKANQLGFLLEEYGRRFPDAQAQGRVLWCFDEIQAVKGWERFARRLLDMGGCDITLTGSSAALLSREVGTALRGRGWEVPLYPFSFAEFLEHRKVQVPADPSFLTPAERGRLEHELLEWLDVGGFPEVQSLDRGARRQLLQDYVDVAILRDVIERHSVSNVHGLRWLVRHLLGNAGGLFSVEKFHRALKSQGLAISRDTLYLLLSYLEDCFLVRTVWMEADSERQRMVNPRKAYPVDAGLIPLFDVSGRRNIGHALETAVLVELERRRSSVSYVRTPGGFEVDFLARSQTGELELVQVCADASDPATAARELRALTEAGSRSRRKARKRLLTLTRDSMPAEAPPGVIVQPVYEWLLTPSSEG
jgi:predicted AAA+ superfamily ATPase